MALSALYHEKYFGHSSFRSQLQRHQDNSPVPWGWFVLVGPRRRKPVQCIPCLLWYDVIQWRMDHVLHHWWIRETQKWGDVQPWFPLWSGRVQNKLQQYSCKLHLNIPRTKMTPFTKRSQLKSSFLFKAKFINCTLIVSDFMQPLKMASDLMLFVKVVTHCMTVVTSLQFETTGSIFLLRIWRDLDHVSFACWSNRWVIRMYLDGLLITVFWNLDHYLLLTSLNSTLLSSLATAAP